MNLLTDSRGFLSRIKEVQPVTGLRCGAGVDENLDQDLAIGRNAVRNLHSAACIFGRRQRTRAEQLLQRKDPGVVVIDEVAGQLIALLSVPTFVQGWWGILTAFLLFRAFDIWKPYPARRLEKLESGLGIMSDDVVAGAYAAVVNSIMLGVYFLLRPAS